MTAPQTRSAPATFCDAPATFIIETYFVLRMVIAGGAILLPVALVAWVIVDPDLTMMDSLSASYYTPARSLFVGTLVAIGVALVAYRGYTRGENLLLNAAGVLAVVTALFPTVDPAVPGVTLTSVVHAVAAVSFFVLAALSIFFYGERTVCSITDPRTRQGYRVTYRFIMVLLLVFPALALLLAWLAASSAALFAVEAVALFAFAAFWLVKTVELSRTHRQTKVV
ncbi:hypothetical protein [Dietzia sp. CH92]|uniref:hypothetical protein n=1 Tax=Dietzia sp. CH92 TaxID=3051823 RepID=UPI0028D64297|nr:hypothetical protein [Dietzia sp. CH92]